MKSSSSTPEALLNGNTGVSSDNEHEENARMDTISELETRMKSLGLAMSENQKYQHLKVMDQLILRIFLPSLIP